MHNKKYLLIFPCLVSLSSCKDEPVPAYLYIPSISVNARSYEGSSSSNISDVWVFQDFNLQGEYEMPVEFPILAEGNTQLLVYAGIKLNGIATTRAIYPFYNPDTVNVTFHPGKIDTVTPVVTYASSAEFDFIEDFENGNEFDHMQRVSGGDVFEGSFSGKLIADTVEVLATSNSTYEIPFNTTAVFLEMDYKNTHFFEVGIKAIAGAESFDAFIMTASPSDEWNKLYVNLTPLVNGLQANEYRVIFKVEPDAPPNDIHIFLDNVKLIHAKT